MFKGILVVLAFVIIFAAPTFASSGWIIYRESAFKGKVIDTETKEPIEGAVVVAIYRIREYSFVESGAAVADVKEVLTDKYGEFNIPQHTFFSFYPVANGEAPVFIIYKPGYASISELRLKDILTKDTGKWGELPWLTNKDLKFIFAPRLIGLPKVKKREERKQARMDADIFGAEVKEWELPLLYKMVEEEYKKGFD